MTLSFNVVSRVKALGAKLLTALLITGFGCITVGDAATYTYPKLNAYSWTVTTNRSLSSYADLVMPNIALSDTPPPPSYAERAHNQQVSRERQERYRKRVPIPNAVSDKVMEDYIASSAPPPSVAAMPASSSLVGYLFKFFLYAALFFLVGLLAIWKFAPEILVNFQRELNPWVLDPTKVTAYSAKVRAEEEAFTRFLKNFRVGPALPSSATNAAENGNKGTKVERDPLREFIERAASLLLKQRKIFQDIDRAWNDSARRRMIADLRREMNVLMEEANFPQVLLIWQAASAMEGLLKQLADRAENINASTLRTIRGGVDLLADLCAPGFKPDMLSERPLRFLAVDDDLVSRQALSVALKKALNQPDLALDGQGAMVLANKHAYDVIFLDIQMPDMDGFELCTKIRQTEINRTAPVVFVTSQSDFNARAQSTLSGGSDLIGKPFLTFEVTVKALTLALRGRMQEQKGANTLPAAEKPPVKPQPVKAASIAEIVSAPADNEIGAAAGLVATTPTLPEDKRVAEFVKRITKHLPALKKNCRKILETSEAKLRQDNIADAFLGVHSFVPDAGLVLKQPTFKIVVALEGLLRKLLEDQKHCTDSAIATVITAVDLLHDLCAQGIAVNIFMDRPVEILVVDDDTFSRRAVTGALQLAFEKPLDVSSGEAALAVTAEKAFDVIFMDVVMPGMDGFATCAKIREGKLNRATPVVFVTSQSDYAARAQMTQSGGNELIGKPFLPAEITLKALTFAVSGRLPSHKNGVITSSAES